MWSSLKPYRSNVNEHCKGLLRELSTVSRPVFTVGPELTLDGSDIVSLHVRHPAKNACLGPDEGSPVTILRSEGRGIGAHPNADLWPILPAAGSQDAQNAERCERPRGVQWADLSLNQTQRSQGRCPRTRTCAETGRLPQP